MQLKNFICSLVVLCGSIYATDYYVSSTGNDAVVNPTETTPWKTIDKVNAMMASFKPGDRILFKRGESFNGTLKITVSGSSGNPIVFSAYGTGNNLPIITGSAPVTQWVNTGGNIWKAYHSKNGNSGDVSGVFIDGVFKEIGRYPNREGNLYQINLDGTKGYHFPSKVADSVFTFDGPDMTGGTCIWKNTPYSRDQATIVSQSGGNIYLSKKRASTAISGVVITNHRNTLDKDGEWYFDKSVDTLYLFSTTDPNLHTIEATNRDHLIESNDNVSNITISDLIIQRAQCGGASGLNSAVKFNKCSNIILEKCSFINNGPRRTVSLGGGSNLTVRNCSFTDNNSFGIMTDGTKNSRIENNTFKRQALVFSMADGTPIDSRRDTAIQVIGNRIDSCSYNGIYLKSSTNCLVSKNFVTHWNLIFTDGGALYTHYEHTNLKIYNNIFIDGLTGGNEGLGGTGWANQTRGLYFDNKTNGCDVRNNTIAQAGDIAHTFGNGFNNTEIGNTYIATKNGGITFGYGDPADSISNNTIRNNIFFSQNLNYPVVRSVLSQFNRYAQSDSNHYVTPFLAKNYISDSTKSFGIAGWQSLTGFDLHSTGSPVYISPVIRDSVTQPNRVTNSTFDNNITGWKVATTEDGFLADGLDGGSLTPHGKRAYTPVGSVVAGKKYACTFNTYGDDWNGSVKIAIMRGTDFSSLGHVGTASIPELFFKGARRDGMVIFTATAKCDTTTLVFTFSKSLVSIIDNVEFYEISSEKNTDDYVLFDYNAADLPKTINLGTSTFVDAFGKSYKNTASIAPYSSLVLIKVDNVMNSEKPVLPVVAEQIRLKVINRGNKAYAVLNNPGGKEFSVKLYTVAGRVLINKEYKHCSQATLDISGYAHMVYLLLIEQKGLTPVIRKLLLK